MGISFKSAPSYFWLNTWVLANIIELATQRFCDRFVDFKIDPGHRLYDQMTQAARSIRANIAEGSGRHETSMETEMRLTDVARGSVHELMGDFINYMMRFSIRAWEIEDRRFQSVINLVLDKPVYGANFVDDAMEHIKKQKSRFDCFLERGNADDAANCLVALCLKIIRMLTNMMSAQLDDFKQRGGFTENLTQTRLSARREEAAQNNAPVCPKCGKTMLQRTIQKGTRQGEQFWGCSDYPKCNGTRSV
ncbi:MAG: four helix bundle protein [Clostridium sp.]|nr:four helix bundle protein [Clostridium sp.]